MGIRQNWERFHPYCLGLAIGTVSYKFPIHPTELDVGSWLSASITFSAILLGFLATAQSILATTRRDKDTVIGKILLIPEYKLWLTSYFHEAFITLSIFSIYNLAGFFVNKPYSNLLISIWFALCVIGITTFYRIYRIATKIVTDPTNT